MNTAIAMVPVQVPAMPMTRVLRAYLTDASALSNRRLRSELVRQTKNALVHPVFFGSAVTGAGVDALMSGLAELLPTSTGDIGDPRSAMVFKVERSRTGERVAVRGVSGLTYRRGSIRGSP